MRLSSSPARRVRGAALIMAGLTATALLLSACEDPITRYNHSPAYQQEVQRSLEQDKKGNGCLKC
jgi:hypothetical protein